MVECHDRFAISCRVGNHSITLCQEASEFGQGRVDGIDGRDIFRESVEIILSRAIGPVCLHSIASDRAFSRSEEHTSELQSLMRISYAVFCLKKKKKKQHNIKNINKK